MIRMNETQKRTTKVWRHTKTVVLNMSGSKDERRIGIWNERLTFDVEGRQELFSPDVCSPDGRKIARIAQPKDSEGKHSC